MGGYGRIPTCDESLLSMGFHGAGKPGPEGTETFAQRTLQGLCAKSGFGHGGEAVQRLPGLLVVGRGGPGRGVDGSKSQAGGQGDEGQDSHGVLHK